MALIRKNKIQTTVQVRRSEVSPALIPSDQTEPGPEETHVDQNKQTTSEVSDRDSLTRTLVLDSTTNLFALVPGLAQVHIRSAKTCRAVFTPASGDPGQQTRRLLQRRGASGVWD